MKKELSLENIEVAVEKIVEKVMKKSLEHIDSKFERVDAKLAEHDARFEKIEGKLGYLDAKIDGLGEVMTENFDSVFDQLDQIRYNTLDQGKRIAALEDAVRK